MTYELPEATATVAPSVALRPLQLSAGAAARYLKAMWYLSAGDEPVTVGRVAKRVGVSHASASTAIKQLVQDGFAERGSSNEIALTERGEAESVRLVRRHRLVETFLAAVLGFGWDEVHDNAETLEWVLTDDMVDRMARVLGEPERNPRGDLIPTVEGVLPRIDDLALAELEPGTKARVTRVGTLDAELLKYLAAEGLGIGTVVTVERREPFGGPLWLRTSRGAHALGERVVDAISVTRVEDPAAAAEDGPVTGALGGG